MSIIINYPKQFSKEYKDFIIVLSKLSELKNIKNLPFDTNSLSKSKELEKTKHSWLKINKHLVKEYTKLNKEHKILIKKHILTLNVGKRLIQNL